MESSIQRLTRLSELLRQEQHAEEERYKENLNASNISGRMHESGVHYPIAIGEASYNALGNLILHTTYEYDEEIIENEFEPSKTVIFFHIQEDSICPIARQCLIERVEDGKIDIRLPDSQCLQQIKSVDGHHLLGIQIGIDNTSYTVMQEALRHFITTTDERKIELRETLIGLRRPRFTDKPLLRFSWLNESQNQAIQKIVEAKDIAIIHGPPGTGKTTTMVEAIIETLQREPQVMVCAPSNTAVDWISEQLSLRGIHVLRIGNPMRINDEMLACCYERRYADHPDYSELWSIRKLLHTPKLIQEQGQKKAARLQKLRQRQTELEIKINADLFEQASVVACTLIGAGAYHTMNRRRFGTVFIDEAAQALEPACWVAIQKADRVILSGDHQQLPPTVKCAEAARRGLGRTLMQHIVRNKPECIRLLDTQYRMNEDIMRFSSQWFYDGMLKAAPEVAHQSISHIDTPLTWVDTSTLDYQERQNNHTPSLSNAHEAKLLVETLRDYVDAIGMTKIIDDNIDFGIISPYRAQVRILRRMIRSQRYLKPILKKISINTVDGFQGQERDVIIISTVRDNEKGSIGFLNDLRRMNVAITRSKMKLIVVGNTQTLSHNTFYKQLIENFEEYGEIITPHPLEYTEQQP